MSSGGRRGLGDGGGGHDDLCITPLLDLYVALIPFLIVSTVITKINILDVGISKPVAAASSAALKPELDLLVRLGPTKAEILVGGKSYRSFEIATQVEGWTEPVRVALVAIKREHASDNRVRIEPSGEVSLQPIMELIDAARMLKPEDGEILRKDEAGKPVKLQYLFPNVVLRGVYS